MLKELQSIADQIGWPLAIGLFLLIVSEKTGIMSIKIGGEKSSSDPLEKMDQRIDHLESEIHALGIQIARIDAVIDDRKDR